MTGTQRRFVLFGPDVTDAELRALGFGDEDADVIAESEEVIAEFNPYHDRHGRFARKGSGGGAAGTSGAKGGKGTKADPWVTQDVKFAAAAISRGEHVQLSHPSEVATLMTHIDALVKDAKSKGESAPVYDLCKVSVPNTNLFCSESKGIPRIKMPQLGGFPEKGSPADALPRDPVYGGVDLGPSFSKMLTDRGYTITHESVPASSLRATQSELNGAKVDNLFKAAMKGELTPSPLYVTDDGYIIDGHHRWAAEVAYDLATGSSTTQEVYHVHIPIVKALAIANNWTALMGMPQAGVGVQGATTPAGTTEKPIWSMAPPGFATGVGEAARAAVAWLIDWNPWQMHMREDEEPILPREATDYLLTDEEKQWIKRYVEDMAHRVHDPIREDDGGALVEFNAHHDHLGRFTHAGGGAASRGGGGGDSGTTKASSGGSSAHEFKSEAEGKAFLSSHYADWRSSMTAKEDSALAFYQSPGYELMNGQLRGTSVSAPERDLKRAKQATKDLTAAIHRAPPLPRATAVYRGFSAEQFGTLTPGKRITDKGFVSTSTTKEQAGAFNQRGGKAIARIILPKGTRAAAGSQKELILPPGSSFVVKSVQKRGKTTEVELELVS